jgi:hypothetical protein
MWDPIKTVIVCPESAAVRYTSVAEVDGTSVGRVTALDFPPGAGAAAVLAEPA